MMVAFRVSFSVLRTRLRHAFRNLQRDIAHKSVGHNHVNFAVIQIAAFHIAHKIQRQVVSAS